MNNKPKVDIQKLLNFLNTKLYFIDKGDMSYDVAYKINVKDMVRFLSENAENKNNSDIVFNLKKKDIKNNNEIGFF